MIKSCFPVAARAGFATLAVLLCALQSSAQCGALSLSQAEEDYSMGHFSNVVDALTACLANRGYDEDERVQAHYILARTYLAVDSTALADENIRQLLLMREGYEPTATDPNRLRLRVYYVRSQLRSGLISSVSKKAERAELAPATIQIITAEDIRRRGYQDLESIFYDLPGFDISRTYGLAYSVLYQRGYRSSAIPDRTLLLVDGVEDTELWTNAPYLGKQYPVSNIKRVEVIYGPASTIYGTNAFTGVINIVTKGRDDFFPETGHDAAVKSTRLAAQFNGGLASYNTRYYDLTAAVKHRDLFWSTTVRLYQSDKAALQQYANWDGRVNFSEETYRRKLTQDFSAASQAQFDSALTRFQQADPSGRYYTVDGRRIVPTGAAIARADSLDKASYATGINSNPGYENRIKDLFISSQLTLGDFRFALEYVNRQEGSSADYVDNYAAVNSLTNWPVRQYFVSASYAKHFSSRLFFYNLSYYRFSQHGPDSRLTRYYSYGNSGIGTLNLDSLLLGVRPYFATEYFYVQSNQFRSESRLNFQLSKSFDAVAGVEFRNSILQGNYISDSLPSVARTGHPPQSLPGGNNISSFTASGFVELNYQNRPKHLNASLGGRYDYNRFRQSQGYGGVFDPRLALVWYPGNFIAKAIYSEAFLDASSYNKFATSSARRLNNPNLMPERVRNIELSLRYAFNSGIAVEAAVYRAYYSDILGTATVQLPDGTTTTQVQALGRAQIGGLQVAAQAALSKRLTAYANFSITDPEAVLKKQDGADSLVRFGDISKYSLNAGATGSLLRERLLLHLRVNVVGDKLTGKGTTVATNPLSAVPGYAILSTAVTVRLSSWADVQLLCNNLLDTYYESPGVRSADNIVYSAATPQPRRNYGLNLILRLDDERRK